jgi:hypothetical protein
MLTVLEDGKMVEIATVGREGMVGVAAASDGLPVTSAVIVQGATDTCYRMNVDAFRREIERRGAFYELMAHFAQALFGFVAQSTACNAIHTVEQRLARWLLMAQDRMGSDEFPLTQEFVAMMLGASRPTVTVVAGTLQKAGLIKYVMATSPSLTANTSKSHRANAIGPRSAQRGDGRLASLSVVLRANEPSTLPIELLSALSCLGRPSERLPF